MASSRIGCVSATLGLRSVVAQNPIAPAAKTFRDVSRVSPSLLQNMPRRFPQSLLSAAHATGDVVFESAPQPALAEGPFTAEEAARLPVHYHQYTSGYHYCAVENPEQTRKELAAQLGALGIVGRIYIDQGINLQISCHPSLASKAAEIVRSVCGGVFRNARIFNNEITSSTVPFKKLRVQTKKLLNTGVELPEGLSARNIDKYQHLNPAEWHAALQENGKRKDSVVQDVRNLYEYELGSFIGAKPVEVASYHETYPEIDRMLGIDAEHSSSRRKSADNSTPIVPTPGTPVDKDAPIMIYCTGGIRCVPLGAYLAEKGFSNVSTLEGGVNAYAEWARRALTDAESHSLFRGSNAVFDDRRAVKVTPQAHSQCWFCGHASDRTRNCSNATCDILMVQCENCETHLFNGCCSIHCNELQFGRGKQVRNNLLTHNLRALDLSSKPTNTPTSQQQQPWTHSQIKYVPASPGHHAFRPRISPLPRHF